MDIDKLLSSNSDGVSDNLLDPKDLSGEDALKLLVGDEGKYKTTADLARASFFKDAHIARLEAEAKELRAKTEAQMTMEAFLTKIDQSKTGTSAPVVSPPPQEGQGGKGESLDISSVVEQLLAKREQERQAQEAQRSAQVNQQKFVEEIKKAWSGSAKEELNKRCQQLGVSVEQVLNLASSSPELAIRALGVQKKEDPTNGLPPRSSSNSSFSMSSVGHVKNKAYYDKMKKENPRQFNDPKTYMERLASIKALGEKYYSP